MGQSRSERSPLYEKAHAVIDAYDETGDFLPDMLDQALRALRSELTQIDNALASLYEIRERIGGES